MLTFDLRGSQKKIETVLREHSVELSREIINCICGAIDTGASRVTCMVVLTDNEEFNFTASRHFYADALETNITTMAEVEEYELCAKAKKYIDRLQIKLLVDSK